MVRDDPLADLSRNEVGVAEAGQKTRSAVDHRDAKEKKQDALDRSRQRHGLVAALVAVVQRVDSGFKVIGAVVRQTSARSRQRISQGTAEPVDSRQPVLVHQ